MRSLCRPSLLAVLLAACGAGAGSRSSSDLETIVDTVAGVVHVGNAGPPAAWTVDPVLRLGSVDGGPEEFGRIRSLLADADGNIYVADNSVNEIRVFTPDGRHVRSIGRQGGGPGEFGDLYSLAWLEGNLAAMDPRNARIGVVSRDGEWVRGIQYLPIYGSASFIRLHPLTAGFYAPVLTIDGGQPGMPFIRIPSGGAGDTIRTPEPPEKAPRASVLCHRPDGGTEGIPVQEAPAVVFAFPPSGGEIVVSWTESYRLTRMNARGDTLRVVARERPPLPYTDALWEEGTEAYRQIHRDYPGTQCEPSAPERPDYRAYVRHVTFDDEGRMWVEAAADDGFAWEVFDPEGRLLGAAPAPARAVTIPPYVRDGYLYQVETDELDVEYVAVYRIGPRQ